MDKDASDFEINCEVAMLLYPELEYADSDLVTEKEGGAANFRLCNAIGDDLDAGTYDYCGSWSDIGPIIEEYRIHMLSDENRSGHWWAASTWDKSGQPYKSIDENPKRAAALVFIEMMEARQ